MVVVVLKLKEVKVEKLETGHDPPNRPNHFQDPQPDPDPDPVHHHVLDLLQFVAALLIEVLGRPSVQLVFCFLPGDAYFGLAYP